MPGKVLVSAIAPLGTMLGSPDEDLCSLTYVEYRSGCIPLSHMVFNIKDVCNLITLMACLTLELGGHLSCRFYLPPFSFIGCSLFISSIQCNRRNIVPRKPDTIMKCFHTLFSFCSYNFWKGYLLKGKVLEILEVCLWEPATLNLVLPSCM